jgi:hypothetical protein
VHIRRGEHRPRFPHSLTTSTLTTACPSALLLSLLSDNFAICVITDLPALVHFLCTPSPLVSKFWIRLCSATYLVIQGDVIDKCLRLLWVVGQRKGPCLTSFKNPQPNFCCLKFNQVFCGNETRPRRVNLKKSHISQLRCSIVAFSTRKLEPCKRTYSGLVLVTNSINVNTGEKISKIWEGQRVLSQGGCGQLHSWISPLAISSSKKIKKKTLPLPHVEDSSHRDSNPVHCSATQLLKSCMP